MSKMIHKLSHIILGQLEYHNCRGNLVRDSLWSPNGFYVLYVTNGEIKVFNENLIEISEDVGIPEDIYNKYRREIILGIISESGLKFDKKSYVVLFASRLLSGKIIDKWLIGYCI